MNQDDFKKMQSLEMEMLVEFDRVCAQNEIKYIIWGGTLLGAIRHNGFIPWDGDIDVAMLREEYDKFAKIADQLNSDICWFQDHNTDQDYPWGYGKLRRTGTQYVRTGQEQLHCRNGVFIDIFAEDDIPKHFPMQMMQDFWCFILRKIQYAEIAQYDKNASKIYKLLALIPRNYSFKMLDHYIKKGRNNTPNKVRVLTYTAIGKLYFKHNLSERYGMPKKWFLQTTKHVFEGREFPIPIDYDECLTHIFGKNYMELPPKEKREFHTPASFYKF